MRIGIDIDGCLADIARFMIDYGTKFRYENNIKTQVNEAEYDEDKALGLTPNQTEMFWNEYLGLYATKYPARDFASEIIKKLRSEGHKIYIVTARDEEGLPPETYGTMQSMVKVWLSDNDIEYDELIFTKGSKLSYCLDNNIDVMVEDSPYNVKDISQKIPVLCFDNPYNKQLDGDKITRVYSWYEVLEKIENKSY